MTTRYFNFVRTQNTIPALDGLRALAILMVLGRHAINPLFNSDSSLLPLFGWDAAIPMVNGWLGVDLFFALSGFLIGSHLIRSTRKASDLSVRQYLVARALRIVPSYYVVLCIAAAGLFPYYSVSPDLMGLRLVYHLLFLQDYFPADIVVSFWSLGVEEKFYLAAPFIIYFSCRCKSMLGRYMLLTALLLIPVALRCLTAINHPEVDEYSVFFFLFRSPFHVSFDGMVAGLIAAHLYDDITSRRLRVSQTVRSYAFVIALTTIGLHMFLIPLLSSITYYDKTIQGLLISLSFATVVLLLSLSTRPHFILASRAGLVLARISYPLYLVHLPLVDGFLLLYQNHLQTVPLGLLWYCLSFALASVACALLVHFIVEKPFLLLKDRNAHAALSTSLA